MMIRALKLKYVTYKIYVLQLMKINMKKDPKQTEWNGQNWTIRFRIIITKNCLLKKN